MSDDKKGEQGGGQMFIEGESTIDSILGLLWPKDEPLCEKMRVKWKDARSRRCVRRQHLCSGFCKTFQEGRKKQHFVIFECL